MSGIVNQGCTHQRQAHQMTPDQGAGHRAVSVSVVVAKELDIPPWSCGKWDIYDNCRGINLKKKMTTSLPTELMVSIS